MSSRITEEAILPSELGNKRFDQVAAKLFPDYSRSRLEKWIKSGELTVDGETHRGRDKLVGGELLRLDAEVEEQGEWEAQEMDLDIVYEDDDILVVNKPRGLVVHPGSGNPNGTLLNGLLYYVPELIQIPRAGIVHRLDKDTTGLMVVAKTLQAQVHLVGQLQDRSMGREYEAVVQGVMTGGGMIDEPIARHATNRTKMAVFAMGKEAITHYRLLKKYTAYTHIRLKLETGRTHQIRVHMAHLHYPLVGDIAYAGRSRLPSGLSDDLKVALNKFDRQALHARQLELIHPVSGDFMQWQVDLPDDFIGLLEALDQDLTEREESDY
jgi:23S rRNA pseudouridine1911/1915/1917 synthase